jgi:hypothetical protein
VNKHRQTTYNNFVTGLRHGAFAVGVALALYVFGYKSAVFAQDQRQGDMLNSLPEQETDSYDVWSAALRIKDPGATAWAIVQQTWEFKMCLKPARDQESIYGPTFDDYAAKNRRQFILGRRFQLPLYTLVPVEAWTSGSGSGSIAIVSAVGFNRERTSAAVCLWSRNSGTCYLLTNKRGAWQIDGNLPEGCGWAA